MVELIRLVFLTARVAINFIGLKFNASVYAPFIYIKTRLQTLLKIFLMFITTMVLSFDPSKSKRK